MSNDSSTEVRIRPVGRENWDDFEHLFTQRGSPHYCWCSLYRFSNNRRLSKAEKKAGMNELISNQTPIGILAYRNEEPVGWCSVAPRESYAKLERSRTMPRVTSPETPTWTILCFFVLRTVRGSGITHALLSGAVDYAHENGAEVIEAYPFDTAGITSTHRGHSCIFERAGFQRDGRRWFLT